MAKTKPVQRDVLVGWPMDGIYKRKSYSDQPPTTTPDCQNVRPDGLDGREQGAQRPPLRKVGTTQMGTSGSEVRLLFPLTYVDTSDDTNKTRMIGIADGKLYKENDASPGVMTLASDGAANQYGNNQLLQAGEHRQRLYIADNEGQVNAGALGTFTVTSGVFSDSTPDISFATTDPGRMLIEVYEDPTYNQNHIFEIETFGAPTGGDWKVSFRGLETTALTHTDTALDIHTALEALSNIAAGDINQGGGALPTAVTLEFNVGEWKGKDLSGMLVVTDNSMTKGSSATTIRVRTTQQGGMERQLNARYRVSIRPPSGIVISGGKFALAMNGVGTYENVGIYDITGFNTLTGGDYRFTLGGAMTEDIHYHRAGTDEAYMTIVAARLQQIFPPREYEVVVTGDPIDSDDMKLTITHRAGYHFASEAQESLGIFQGSLASSDASTVDTPLRMTLTGLEGNGTIDWDASQATLQTELEALPTVGVGNVVVIKDSDSKSWEIEFINDLGGEAGNGDFIGENITLGVLTVISTATDLLVEKLQVGEDAGSSKASPVGIYKIASRQSTTQITLEAVDNDLPVVTPTANGALLWRMWRSPKYYDPNADTTTEWVATRGKGYIPVGKPIFTIWRDRAVFAGGTYNAHQIIMSRQGNLHDYDFFQQDVGRALALQNERAGAIGEPVTCLIALNDETLLVGCTSSTWIIRGDPAVGGRITPLSVRVGPISSGAWCITPNQWVYFLTRDGVYVFSGGQGLHSVSRKMLPDNLLNLGTAAAAGNWIPLLKYDLTDRGIHLFVTDWDNTQSTKHFWLDLEQTVTGDEPGGRISFWPVLIPKECAPHCLADHDDLTTAASSIWLGGRDGFARVFDSSAATQRDGGTSETDIASYIKFGPFRLRPSMNEPNSTYVIDRNGRGMLSKMAVTLKEGSNDVAWEVAVGNTHEAAVEHSARESGVFDVSNLPSGEDGLQYIVNPRCGDYAGTIKLASSEAGSQKWAFEKMRVSLRDSGLQRIL